VEDASRDSATDAKNGERETPSSRAETSYSKTSAKEKGGNRAENRGWYG
jgi:hypothetical protein